MTTYKPKQRDVEWAKFVLSAITEGAVLVMPSYNLYYRVRHKVKKMVLILGDPKSEVHLRTIAVFGKIGYSVSVQPEPNARVAERQTRHSRCCRSGEVS